MRQRNRMSKLNLRNSCRIKQLQPTRAMKPTLKKRRRSKTEKSISKRAKILMECLLRSD